jgi:TolB protein
MSCDREGDHVPSGTIRERTASLIAVLAIGTAGCTSAPVPSTPGTTLPAVTTATTAEPVVVTAAPSAVIGDLPGQIVFVAEQAAPNHAQIWIQNANGTNLRQLVTSAFDDRSPAISPDGKRVLFTRYVPDGAPLDNAGVFVINVDGTGLRQIDMLGEDPSWSPDGSRIVLTRGLFDTGSAAPYNVALWTEKLDGTGLRQVTRKGLRCDNGCPGGYQDNRARWSPDGTTLVFMRDNYTTPEQHEIWWIFPQSSILHEMRVTPQGLDADDPQWSRDGTRILFQSPAEPSTAEQNLYTITRDGTGPKQLTSHLSNDPGGVSGVFHAAWSPDGTMIVFSKYPGATSSGAALYVIKADGTGMRIVTAPQFDANGADWGILPAP